jgi:formylglycine-generating enzyme required for sulfatase activity
MSMPFDPYHKWLGIPPNEQPPTYYRLLGISIFEGDPDVIDAAANRTMAYLQTCAADPYLPLSQRLLNEVAAARVCLLGIETKAEYDRTLRLLQASVHTSMAAESNNRKSLTLQSVQAGFSRALANVDLVVRLFMRKNLDLAVSRFERSIPWPRAKQGRVRAIPVQATSGFKKSLIALALALLACATLLAAVVSIEQTAKQTAAEASNGPPPALWALYRFYDRKLNEHIYTYGLGMPPIIRSNPNMSDETIIGYIAVSDVPGTRRFWNVIRVDGSHYFSIDRPTLEGFVRVEKFEVYVWRDNGIGRIPIHGCWLPDGTDLFLDSDLEAVKKVVDTTRRTTGVNRQVATPMFYVYKSEIAANSRDQRPASALADARDSILISRQAGAQRSALTNVLRSQSTGMAFVLIKGGEFLMGSAESDKDAKADEKPQHLVRISPFLIGVTEVTQAQYVAVMGTNPSYFAEDGRGEKRIAGQSTERFPVDQVSWYDAVRFCNSLSKQEGLTAFYDIAGLNISIPNIDSPGYRLPTEAEWEYACRAGATTVYPVSNDPSVLGDYAWYKQNSSDVTHTVAKRRPNAWGLFDMEGNVHEWCWDRYDADYYRNSRRLDPRGPAQGEHRIFAGGSYCNDPFYCRLACRMGFPPAYLGTNVGIRVARNPSAAIKNPARSAQPTPPRIEPPTDTGPPAQNHLTPTRAASKHAPSSANSTAVAPKSSEQQIALGKAQITHSFTCKKCGATISQFPVALHAADLRSLEDDCRVHLQSSQWKNGQKTGVLDKTHFSWIASGASSRSNLVDVREIIRAEDPRYHNHNEWALVFALRDSINLSLANNQPSRRPASRSTRSTPKPLLKFPSDLVNFPSNLVGKFAWIETRFLTQVGQTKAFRIVVDEVYFSEVHIPRLKVQQFWHKFCREYAKIESKALPSEYHEFLKIINKTLVDSSNSCGISPKIAETIFHSPTELGLQKITQYEQTAIDKLRTIILAYDR